MSLLSPEKFRPRDRFFDELFEPLAVEGRSEAWPFLEPFPRLDSANVTSVIFCGEGTQLMMSWKALEINRSTMHCKDRLEIFIQKFIINSTAVELFLEHVFKIWKVYKLLSKDP